MAAMTGGAAAAGGSASSWLVPALIGGGSLLGGLLSANAAQNSAQDIEQAAAVSGATQLGMYQQTRSDLLPYMESGRGALNQLDSLMGITPSAAPPDTTGNLSAALENEAGIGSNTTQPAPSPGRGTLMRLSDPANLAGGVDNGRLAGPLSDIFAGGAGAPGPGLSHLLPGLARGGNANGGRAYVVGERGPEILHMGPGSRGYVEPNGPRANRAAYGRPSIPGRLMGGPVTGPIGGGYYGAVKPPTANPLTNIKPVTSNPAYKPMGGVGDTLGPGFMSDGMYYSGSPSPPSYSYDPTTAINHPYSANNTPMSNGGATPGMTPAQVMALSPQYQFTEEQGLEGLDNSAAASGGLLSGGHLAAILNYSQGLASQQYQNIYNNLMGVTSLGESAGAMVGNSGTYAGMGAGSSAMAAGNAAAAGTVGSANAYSNMFGNLGFMYAMNPGMFGGTSGGG